MPNEMKNLVVVDDNPDILACLRTCLGSTVTASVRPREDLRLWQRSGIECPIFLFRI